MSILGVLGIISGLSLNLITHFGLGIQYLDFFDENHKKFDGIPLIRGGILFLSLPLLWFFFSYILVPLSLGFLEYMVLFPLSVLVCMGLEAAVNHFFPNMLLESNVFSPRSAYNGLIPAALVLSFYLVSSLVEAIVLSLGFYLGLLSAVLILRELQKRSSREAVPRRLRGVPLMLISVGLLSLIFSFIGTILIKFLGFY
jgi:electron transport complex protein RnfA